VASDFEHVKSLYERLVAAGLRVWWDSKCLKAGEEWEKGFCDGLVDSDCFVCLLSRGAVNNPDIARQNFGELREDSKCDNVLLEHMLALELHHLGLIRKVDSCSELHMHSPRFIALCFNLI
jgi:hypothetical protein